MQISKYAERLNQIDTREHLKIFENNFQAFVFFRSVESESIYFGFFDDERGFIVFNSN